MIRAWAGASLVGLALAWSAVVPASEVEGTAPVGVAFVYPSAVTDRGWSTLHDAGRRAVARRFGDAVSVRVIEGVAEGLDALEPLRQLAADGPQIVFVCAASLEQAALRVAAVNPDVRFEVVNGSARTRNVGNYTARVYEAAYLAGVLAATVAPGKSLGFVAPFPVPVVLQSVNAFALGARSVDPAIRTRVAWTSSWFDPERERRAALGLVADGVGLLTHMTDSTAVADVAQAQGVPLVAHLGREEAAAPAVQLANVTFRWAAYYENAVRDVLERARRPGSVSVGLKDGVVALDVAASRVAAPVAARIDTLREAIATKRLQPFRGPLRTMRGDLRLAAGGVLSDEEIARMDFLVDSIVVRSPRPRGHAGFR